jgi:Chaperone of endosialidase
MAFVPYTGADENVDLGAFNLNANAISINEASFPFGEVLAASQTYSETAETSIVADFSGTQNVGTTGTLEIVTARAFITNTSGTVTNTSGHVAIIDKSGAGALTEASSHVAVFVSSGGTTTKYTGYHVVQPNLSGGAVLINNHAFLSEIGAGDLHIGDGGYIGGAVQFGNYGAGTATFDASGNITSVSDERLKNIQGSYEAGLAEILKLDPIIYKWKPGHNMETEHDYAGFSAQNVRDNIPLSTGISADGYLSLQDRAIMAALVNSVKELEAEIVKLKEQIK